MISQITGTIDHISENALLVRASGISYEVHIPTAIIQSLNGRLKKDTEISLITYHYYQTDPSKSIPILIGFANRIEREFFEKFITVSGVGPKAAVKALKFPIADIAQAIDGGDLAYLKSLPGIGEQRAKEIIAKLQGKMGKFGLMPGGGQASKDSAPPEKADIQNEAVEVLIQLQYRKEEAGNMVQKAFTRKANLSSVEEILNEVYRQRKTDGR
ncbi:MAG: Holliday junction branch migration protein RuvA [Candidatus Omnitrophica bacterium]|nr:Holliday junction branch migration protein RuvA [Candidatus Omnitrophota bacterium]